MQKGEALETLALLYILAFFIGSLWDLLFPEHSIPGVFAVFRDALPEQSVLYYITLPIVAGLFFGITGIPLSFYLGYEHREMFALLAVMTKADLSQVQAVEPSAGTFACFVAWLVLAVSGSVLGASFSYLHEDSRGEMLISGLLYLASALFLSMEGCA